MSQLVASKFIIRINLQACCYIYATSNTIALMAQGV